MYGPVAPPSPPPYRRGPGGAAIVVRLLFASFPVWSLGMLAWVPSLRFAVLRRRPLDWAVFALFLALSVLEIVLALATPDDPDSDLGVAMGGFALALIIGATTHAVLADRFPRPPAPYAGYAPYPTPPAAGGHPGAPPATAAGYGYPGPVPPPGPAAPHQQPTVYAPPPGPPPGPSAPTPPPASTAPPASTPPPGRPAPPARMRQVASELDELDALLRKRDGR
ncbi:hypothetical protein [Streptomyces chumphonensis]|uniref:hypothetical protein n=1 Tax=Streptomyces chumphonensis TaxID=1214925 RepID=UPI003D72BB0E